MPVWTPDGQWIIYEKGTPVTNLYRRRSNGAGGEERLTTSRQRQEPGGVSPDGKWLAYVESDPVSGSDIWILPLLPVSAPRPYVNTNFAEAYPSFSPDGRWIAYQSNDSGRFEVFVRSFPDGQSAFRVSTEGGLSPQWAPSGREIFFRGGNNRIMTSQVNTAGGFQSSPPRMLFDARQYENSFAVAPDGQRLLMLPLIGNESAATQINVVQNFLSELRQRVR
jgi:eukaryotic-like serine/threonine-protein kinase